MTFTKSDLTLLNKAAKSPNSLSAAEKSRHAAILPHAAVIRASFGKMVTTIKSGGGASMKLGGGTARIK